MTHTGHSIKAQLDQIAQTNYEHSHRTITFGRTEDFSPHNESFLGPLPMVYSFGPVFDKMTDWMELKDGFFSLLPLISKGVASSKTRIVLPDAARFFYAQEDFYYSRFTYREISSDNQSTCFVLLDYYQGLSSQEQLDKNLQKLFALCDKFREVKLCLAISGISSKESSQLFLLMNAIRSFPANCKIIGNEELFSVKVFQGMPIYLLTDEDFVLKSPWENIFITRGARIDLPKLNQDDEIVLTVPMSPGVDKVVYRHFNKSYKINPETQKCFTSLFKLVKTPQDLLRSSYLRQLRDLVKLVQRATK